MHGWVHQKVACAESQQGDVTGIWQIHAYDNLPTTLNIDIDEVTDMVFVRNMLNISCLNDK